MLQWFRSRGAMLVLAAFMLAGLTTAPASARSHQELEISTQPSLYPPFDDAISDYVTRCEPSRRVDVSVTAPRGRKVSVDNQRTRTGSFMSSVALRDGQRFRIAVTKGGRSEAYNVRCLPSDFPGFTAERSGRPEAEWYIVAPFSNVPGTPAPPPTVSTRYVAIFDTNGTPLWWMRTGANAFDPKLLSNGRIAWLHALGTTPAFQERALDGTIVRTLDTAGSGADHHDVQLLPNGNYLLARYYDRPGVDLAPCGGSPNQTIQDNEIQEVTPSGSVVWTWDASDHIPVSEVNDQWRITCGPGPGDIYHWNSFEPVGSDLIVSFRHLNAIYRISRRTGEVIWKLGGTHRAESLTILNDPIFDEGSGFGGQHYARQFRDGTLTLQDNGSLRSRPPRAVRYRINPVKRTATLVETMTDPDAPDSVCCGSSVKLSGGNWVMQWGANTFVTELTPRGRRVFKLSFTDGLFSYRVDAVPYGKLARAALRRGMDAIHPR